VAGNEILRLNQPMTNPTMGFSQSVIILQEWCS